MKLLNKLRSKKLFDIFKELNTYFWEIVDEALDWLRELGQ